MISTYQLFLLSKIPRQGQDDDCDVQNSWHSLGWTWLSRSYYVHHFAMILLRLGYPVRVGNKFILRNHSWDSDTQHIRTYGTMLHVSANRTQVIREIFNHSKWMTFRQKEFCFSIPCMRYLVSSIDGWSSKHEIYDVFTKWLFPFHLSKPNQDTSLCGKKVPRASCRRS